MAQSLSRVLLHVIFSTRSREPLISEEVQPALHAYLAGACRGIGSDAYRVGGTQDHVHIICSLPRTLTISKLLEEIKKSSSAWIKNQAGNYRHFSWQAGYGAFSVGQSQLPGLVMYVEGQGEHHRARTFKEEFLEFLVEYNIEYDERYIWE